MSRIDPNNAAGSEHSRSAEHADDTALNDAAAGDDTARDDDAVAAADADPVLDQRPSSVPWPPLVLAGVAVLAIVLGSVAPVAWPGVDDTPARFIGLGIGVLGIVLVAWGIITLRVHGTTMLPDAGATRLVTSGPFRRFRNPIYLGDAMILLGAAELTKNIWLVGAAAAFAALVTKLAIIPEEQHLERRFGQAYRDYKSRSRRWI